MSAEVVLPAMDSGMINQTNQVSSIVSNLPMLREEAEMDKTSNVMGIVGNTGIGVVKHYFDVTVPAVPETVFPRPALYEDDNES